MRRIVGMTDWLYPHITCPLICMSHYKYLYLFCIVFYLCYSLLSTSRISLSHHITRTTKERGAANHTRLTNTRRNIFFSMHGELGVITGHAGLDSRRKTAPESKFIKVAHAVTTAGCHQAVVRNIPLPCPPSDK